ncbi:MAG: hypothetical protein JXQ91_04740 [Vannielia sp.]|uniref:thiamine pyrophosphate-dependent enzyme n=1 Tax=Vannielia sp. TaxID=2813045 RepID=UPI003B8C89A5
MSGNEAQRTTGEALAAGLAEAGTEVVFGIPGAHMYAFNDALAREAGRIRFIHTRHEQGAGYMAYGYARSSGRPGVFTVVPGPGVLNAGAALSTAYAGGTPVLCVTGNIFSNLIGQGRGQLHELPDQLATLGSLTRWTGRVEHANETGRMLGRAFAEMARGRGGPAAIEAPWDVMASKGTLRGGFEPETVLPPPLDEDQLAQAAEMIAGAKNPMIFVGFGAMDAGPEVLALARKLGVPVVAHRSGKGVIPEDDPLAVNMVAGYDLYRECDLVIGIGSRLELPFMRWQWKPEGLKVLRIDIDPTEAVRLKPDAFLLGDAAEACAALLTRVAEGPDRAGAIEAARQAAEAKIDEVQPQVGFLKAIRAALPRDGFFVEEISQVGFTARFAFPVYEPRTYVTSAYQENLGFGYNTALGVKVANPDKAVVAVTGDGGFLFGAQEMATAAQHRIGVVVVVFDNGAYGNVLRDQDTQFEGRRLGAELGNPDFVAMAKSFGLHAERADTPEALEVAVKAAIERDEPALICVKQARGSDGSPWPLLMPAPHGAAPKKGYF